MRNQYQDGDIQLIVQFTNADGTLINPDSTPQLSIFSTDPSDSSVVDGDAIVLNATTSSLGGVGQQGTNLVILHETGIYSYTWPVAIDRTVGTYYDRWVATIDGVSSTVIFSFDVLEKISMVSLELDNNYVVTITLDETIADTDGNTLAEDYAFRWSTTLYPYYVSSDIVDLELGSYLGSLDTETIDFTIWQASKESDLLTYTTSITNSDWYNHARRQYVMCRTGMLLLQNTISVLPKKKKLDQLEVQWDTESYQSFINDMREACLRWKRVLASGGELSEHTSLKPRFGIKGRQHADRPAFGRSWNNSGRGANSRTYTKEANRRVVHSWEDDATDPDNKKHN